MKTLFTIFVAMPSMFAFLFAIGAVFGIARFAANGGKRQLTKS